MLFRKTMTTHLHAALATANIEYAGNLRLVDVNQKGSGTRARLSVKDSHAYGARRSQSGRHGPYASWEAHRDFLRALFAVNPQAAVVTGLAQRVGVPAYTAENFEQVFPRTADINIGSIMQPCTMPECSV